MSTITENPRKKTTILAELVSAEVMNNNKGVILTLTSDDNKDYDVVTSVNFWNLVKKEEGSIVKAELEILEENKTTYIDKNKKVVLDDRDGFTLSKLTRGSKRAFLRKQDMNSIQNVDPDFAMATATYLGQLARL